MNPEKNPIDSLTYDVDRVNIIKETIIHFLDQEIKIIYGLYEENKELKEKLEKHKKVIDDIKQLMVNGRNHWTILDIQKIISKLGDKN